MSDERSTALLSDEAMGSFDAEGNYVPRQITDDDLPGDTLEDVMADTIVEFDDGDVVDGPAFMRSKIASLRGQARKSLTRKKRS